MKQYRHILLLAVLSFLTSASYSQQDSRADKFLQAVSNQFDLNKAYVIRMDYIREDLMQETSAEGEGVIWMKGLASILRASLTRMSTRGCRRSRVSIA